MLLLSSTPTSLYYLLQQVPAVPCLSFHTLPSCLANEDGSKVLQMLANHGMQVQPVAEAANVVLCLLPKHVKPAWLDHLSVLRCLWYACSPQVILKPKWEPQLQWPHVQGSAFGADGPYLV